MRGQSGHWADVSPSLEPPEGVTCSLAGPRLEGGERRRCRSQWATAANNGQPRPKDLDWQLFTGLAIRYLQCGHGPDTVHIPCVHLESRRALSHMRQRDILSVILYSDGTQEGIAICVVHSSRVGQ